MFFEETRWCIRDRWKVLKMLRRIQASFGGVRSKIPFWHGECPLSMWSLTLWSIALWKNVWALHWKGEICTRIWVFIWKVTWEKILTMDQLRKSGWLTMTLTFLFFSLIGKKNISNSKHWPVKFWFTVVGFLVWSVLDGTLFV